MTSNNEKKLIRSLQQKKYRQQEALFLIEGEKILLDLLHQNLLHKENIRLLCGTKNWIEKNTFLLEAFSDKLREAEASEMAKLSGLVTAPEVLALVRIPKTVFSKEILKTDNTLVLDAVRDPGNLGTIIRTADWFGIRNIICSSDSVDCYNSKVVQASMGAIMRVNIHYHPLNEILEMAERMKIPIYGTSMDGADLYDSPLKNPGLIVFGNEANGISSGILPFVNQKIRIPDYPKGKSGSESLNVAASLAIICAEIRRRG